MSVFQISSFSVSRPVRMRRNPEQTRRSRRHPNCLGVHGKATGRRERRVMRGENGNPADAGVGPNLPRDWGQIRPTACQSHPLSRVSGTGVLPPRSPSPARTRRLYWPLPWVYVLLCRKCIPSGFLAGTLTDAATRTRRTASMGANSDEGTDSKSDFSNWLETTQPRRRGFSFVGQECTVVGRLGAGCGSATQSRHSQLSADYVCIVHLYAHDFSSPHLGLRDYSPCLSVPY